MKKKMPTHFSDNKLAFDQTMIAYRSAKDTGIGAAVWSNGGGTVTKNPARPSLTDFRCDCEKVIESVLDADQLLWFEAAHVLFDSTDYIERGAFAEKLLGPNRARSWEQRIGAKFIVSGLYPVAKYLLSIRKPRL